MVADELWDTLLRFHREVAVPDIERIVDSRVTPLRVEMVASFDAVWKRFDRLESEHYSLAAADEALNEELDKVGVPRM